MSNDYRKILDNFLELGKLLENPSEQEKELYNKLFRLLELFTQVASKPDSVGRKLLRSLLNSIFYNLIGIDERVIKKLNFKRDQIVSFDAQTLYNKKQINTSFIAAIDKHVQIPEDFLPGGITVESVINQYYTRGNDKKKIQINFDWLIHLISKYTQEVGIYESQISELKILNFILNFKVYFTEQFFPQLIDIFKTTNNLGTDDTNVLLKYLINNHLKALSPNKQLLILSTLVFDDKGFEVCKKTSDEYSKIMLQIYQDKLFHLQGCKDDDSILERKQKLTQTKSKGEIEKIIDKELHYLPGKNLKGEIIMTNEEYLELRTYTISLILNKELPYIKSPIRRLDISNQTIMYSFYQIHKRVFGTSHIRDFFIDFLKSYFTQFEKYDKATIKTKFSVKPNRFPF